MVRSLLPVGFMLAVPPAPAAAVEIVICTGHGPQSLTLDDQGVPVPAKAPMSGKKIAPTRQPVPSPSIMPRRTCSPTSSAMRLSHTELQPKSSRRHRSPALVSARARPTTSDLKRPSARASGVRTRAASEPGRLSPYGNGRGRLSTQHVDLRVGGMCRTCRRIRTDFDGGFCAGTQR